MGGGIMGYKEMVEETLNYLQNHQGIPFEVSLSDANGECLQCLLEGSQNISYKRTVLYTLGVILSVKGTPLGGILSVSKDRSLLHFVGKERSVHVERETNRIDTIV